jgi:sugar (pentulose or hexulose) kinase
MTRLQGLLVIGALAAAAAGAHAGTAASECTAGMQLGQREQPPASAVATLQERMDEYLELHARAVEANGRHAVSVWPRTPFETN